MKNPDLTKILFVHNSLSQYHLPRLQHLSDQCDKAGISFHNIELSGHLKAYSDFVTERRNSFANTNLFPDQLLEDVPNDRLWLALNEKLDEIMPDVIFLYGYSLDSMRRTKLWADKRGIATVLLSDSNTFDKKRYKLFEFIKSRFVSRFDAAFVGGTSSSEYIQSLGIPAERIVTGYDVIDTVWFDKVTDENRKNPDPICQKWNLPENYFLYVGRLIPEKNLKTLLIAYEKYLALMDHQSSPWNLVICGSGPEEAMMQAVIRNFSDSTKGKISLRGYIKQPEVIDFFSLASCFVLPSVSESWGLVVNEALACGLPVIVTNKAGCANDLVCNDENGWCIDPYVVNDLSNRFVQITKMDEPARKMMGIRGKERISQWGLDKFSFGALESARIAINHHQNRSLKGMA